MTNGIGGPHGQKRAKETAGKKAKAKDPKAAPKRKGWIPAALARPKQD